MNALIIDDEKLNRDTLNLLLQQYCPGVKVIGLAESAPVARNILSGIRTELIFLDINMPNESGFDFLQSIARDNYAVIFVTAYHEYALRALKANAVDYLLKPIDSQELIQAVEKATYLLHLKKGNAEADKIYSQSLQNLTEDLKQRETPARLTLSHQHGFTIINARDIIYLEADGNYTVLHIASLQKLVVTKAIREFEELLDPEIFIRVHKSVIINLHFLKEYSRVDGNFAIMNDGAKVIVSRRKLEDFIQAVERFAKKV